MKQQNQDSNALPLLLPPDDLNLIDQEHARMERFLRDLYDTYSELEADGAGDRLASSHGRLNSFLYDFLDIISEHFENEERLMEACLAAQEDKDYFQRHRAAHEKLAQQVKILMRETAELSKQGSTALAIRHLYQQIAVMFGDHSREYDNFL
jgi:hemerythrin